MADATREAFEQIFRRLDLSTGHDSWGAKTYAHPQVQCLWEGFQAGMAFRQKQIRGAMSRFYDVLDSGRDAEKENAGA